jgi:site-specific recombinase XerD
VPSWRISIVRVTRDRRSRASSPRCAHSGGFLRREGWIDVNAAALAVAPKREQRVPAHLSMDEMTRLLEMPDSSEPLGRRDRAILELFYASGLRLSELVAWISRTSTCAGAWCA